MADVFLFFYFTNQNRGHTADGNFEIMNLYVYVKHLRNIIIIIYLENRMCINK